jgi:hypothetical protein
MILEKKKKREEKKGKERKGGRIKSKRGETSFANTGAWKSPWKKEDEKFKTSGRDLS